MSIFNQDFDVDQGRGWIKDIFLLDSNKTPIDLRGYVASGAVKPTIYPYTSIANFTCTMIDGLGGHFIVALSEDDSTLMTDSRYEYEIILTSDDVSYSLLKGFLNTNQGVSAYVPPAE